MILRFEDSLAWQKSRELIKLIYGIIKANKDFSFHSQITRAAVSIMNNIAEGFERHSNNEFRHFLYIAKGSCGEVRSMLYLALDLHYILQEEFNKTFNLSLEVSKIISGLIKTL